MEDSPVKMTRARAREPAGPLLERDAELEKVESLLDRARDGQGGLLLVEAAAGLGKSQLLGAARAEAAGRGMEVVHACGSELGSELPFAVCLELFEVRLAGAPEPEREELLAGAARGASAVLDPAVVRPSAPDAAEQLFPILHGLLWLTSNLSERSGLLLAVDDLHWADRPSLQFLLYLSARLAELPVAVVAASRVGEPGATADLVPQLNARPGVVRLSPAPLSETATAQLVRARMPAADGRFCSACASATGGNPFLVSELLAELESHGIGPEIDGAKRVSEYVPESVQNAAEARLRRLGPDAAALARAVVVLGVDAKLRHASRLAGVRAEAAARAADALVASEILQEGEPLGFVHPLVRASIHAAIPAAELAEGHSRAARLIADERAAPERIATHLMAGTRRADRWAVKQLRSAASRALSRGVPDAAVGYLRRALEEPVGDEARAETLLELAEAEALAGRPEAIERLEQALELLADPRERAKLLLRLGRLLHESGQPAEASAALERGLEELDGADESLALELETAFLDTAWLDSSRADKAAELRTALASRPLDGRQMGDRVYLAQSTMAELFKAESSEAVIAYAERLVGGDTLLSEEGPDSLSLWIAVGALSWSDALDSAERITAAALEEARRRGSVTAAAQALYARSWPRYWRGEISDAVADAQAAVDAWSSGAGYGKYLPAAQHWLAVALIERGELDAAEAALELDDPERWQATTLYILWRTARSQLAQARGEWQEALDEALFAGEQLTEVVKFDNPGALPWRSHAALAALRLGQEERARELAAEELRLARRFGAARPIGVALRAAGLAEGGSRGIDLLRESVAVLETSPARLELCRALIDLGAALRGDGRRAEARESLRAGLDMAHRFDALALVDRAEDELRATGARPRRKAISGPDSLTPSERRVAEMAAQDMSNRAIAQALFVTRRTVETHLTHAYAKLEIDSRDELRAALQADGGMSDD